MIEKRLAEWPAFFVPFVRLKMPLTAESILKYYKSLPHA